MINIMRTQRFEETKDPLGTKNEAIKSPNMKVFVLS